MINIIYKKKGLKINAVWFCENINNIINTTKADLIFLHGVATDTYKKSISNKQFSLKTDLRRPQEEIFKQFSKNYRYEINRAKKENLDLVFHDSEELKKNPYLLVLFKKEYEEFVKLKGIESAYNGAAVSKYLENGNIILTKVFSGEDDYAQHFYVHDNTNARLLYSVSNFRTEGLNSSKIGRANKYLHWYDIQCLQGRKINLLDWGGIMDTKNPNGVDNFKIEFGGYECNYHNIVIGKSLIGKMVVAFLKLKRG